MINDIRNTVLSILSKDNNGYLTPEQFNLYSDAAQTEIFEKYQYDISIATNKMNSNQHTSGLGNVLARLSEVIDNFRIVDALTFISTPLGFTKPEDAFSLGTITTTSGITVDPIDHSKLSRLNLSIDTSPTADYPVYTVAGGNIKIYPESIQTANIAYLRYPKKPKWTYVSLVDGEPLFDQGNADYQDFELPLSEKVDLIVKILQYAGVQISNEEVVKAAKTEEIQEKQEHK